MRFEIVPFTKDHLKNLTQLHNEVFGSNVTLNYIKSKYDTSFLGQSYLGFMAYHNHKLVAFYGVIPVLMCYQRHKELAVQSVDSMTLLEYSGKGLFTKLSTLTFKTLKKQGIAFVWGLPNQNSEYAFIKKLGWNYKERMEGFKIPISKFPIERITSKIEFTQNWYTKKANKTFEPYRVNHYFAGSLNEDINIVSVERNPAYYKYKSISNSFVIQLEGCLFWIKIKSGLHIGDIEVSSATNFFKALDILKELSQKLHIDNIIFQASPDTLISKLMKKTTCNLFQSWVIGFQNFNSKFPLEKLKLTYGDLDTF